MTLNEYQQRANETSYYYPDNTLLSRLLYMGTAFGGEAGETLNEIKKFARNDNGVLTQERKGKIVAELGDALWYLSQIAFLIGVPLDAVAGFNLHKIEERYGPNGEYAKTA